MARAKQFGMDLDAGQIAALSGYMNTINVQTKSPRYISPALTYAHRVMSDEFGHHMDRMALAGRGDGMKNPFHHVYEWDALGVPQGRLWDNRLEGRGATRMATFNWRASKVTVPVPSDDLGPNAGSRSFKRIHVFVWKAMVMEYQSSVTIRPKRGQWLGWASDGPNSVDGLEFSKGPITINPGGGNTQGRFTAAFADWWGGAGAEQTFNTQIRKVMENTLAKDMEIHFPKGGRSRTKSMSITSVGNRGGQGYAMGQRAANSFLRANQRNWIEMAKNRERFGGDVDDE